MCLQAKGIRDSNLVIANADLPNLMDNGGTTSWDGSTARSFFKINRDEFTVLGSRTFRLVMRLRRTPAVCQSAGQ